MRPALRLAVVVCTLLALVTPAVAQNRPPQDGGPPPNGPGGGPGGGQGGGPGGPMQREDVVKRVASIGPVLRVAGDGEIRVAPNHATLRLGATAQAPDAAGAQNQVNEIMTRALAAMRELGVEEKDVQTSQLQLWPVYDQQPPDDRGEAREPRIAGYQASNTITIELSDLSKIGPAIDAAVKAGANQLQGVDFSLRNDTRARAEALRQALQQARAKAEALAGAAGMPLGEVVEINEAGVDFRPPEPMMMGRAAMEAAAPTPVRPGELTVTARVNVTYRLRPAGDPGQGPRGERPRDNPPPQR